MVSSYRNSSSTSILVARTTQMILPHNIQHQQINMENCPTCRRVPRQCSPTYVDPSAAAGGYFIAHLHRQAQIFRYHLVDEHLACIFHSATFCNKKVLVANAKIIVPPGEVNIAHRQQNALVISQS